MIRNIIGSVIAVIGAAAAVASPFRAWYDGRQGQDYPIDDLFNGITAGSGDLWLSLLLPFAFAALVTLIGLVLRSRLLVALAGVIVLGFTVLWMVRQGQAAGSLAVDTEGTGLGMGVIGALGGGVLLLIASGLMSGRQSRRGRGVHRYGVGPARYDQNRYDEAPSRVNDWGPEPEPWDTREQPQQWHPPPDDRPHDPRY